MPSAGITENAVQGMLAIAMKPKKPRQDAGPPCFASVAQTLFRMQLAYIFLRISKG